MKQIRYKAWCERLNMVCRVLSIDFLNNDILVVFDETRANQLVLHEGEFELLQFTVLLDKQGVEIYEGDILKVASNGYTNYISAYGDPCYVEYMKDRACFIATTGNGYDTRNAFALNCDAEIEVIGNIYMNPELLKRNTHDI